MMNSKLYFLSIFLLVWFLIISCSEDETVIEPVFETEKVTELVDVNQVFLPVQIDQDHIDDIWELVEDHGFIWSKTPGTTLENSNIESYGEMKVSSTFPAALLHGFEANTIYYFRAYIRMNNQVHYTNEETFKTRPGTWKRMRDFPGEGFIHATGFTVDNKGYVVGGSEVWEYNSAADAWARKNDTPFEIEGATSFVINNVGYIYCGGLWKYLADADTWEFISTPDHSGGTSCKYLYSFVSDNIVYIGGSSNALYSWNSMSNEWRIISPLTDDARLTRRKSAGAMAWDNQVYYIIGGNGIDCDRSSPYEGVLACELTNNQCDYVGREAYRQGFDPFRENMITFSLNSDLYIGLGHPLDRGCYSRVGFRDFFRYNPLSGSWIAQNNHMIFNQNDDRIFIPRYGGVSFVIGDRAFIGLGVYREYIPSLFAYKDSEYKDFWEFIPY